MLRSFSFLIVAAASAGLIAACSAAPDQSGQLTGHGASQTDGPSANGPATGTGNGGDTSNSGNNGATPGSSGGSTTPPSSGGAAPPTQPPPASGPGSTGSAAHQFFDKNVFPTLTNCAGCHASGANGAPKMLDADPDKAYSSLDALGLIQANSMLLTKGVHAGGAAPAASDAQKTVLTQWLQLEDQERGGKSTPNVLTKLAACMDKTEFTNIGIQNLRTTRRTGENANRCTGCNNAQCSSCHGDAQTSFYDQLGSKLGDNTFEMTQQQPYILKYFGLNGTTPVASNGLALKSQATQTGAPYSHPMFTIPATVQTNLDKFVTDTIAKYNAGTCTGTTPAPTTGQ